MAEIPNAADLAIEVARALERGGLPYAIGGAIAYGFYGPPRATMDVDVNVFVPVSEVDRVIDALVGSVNFDREEARARAAERGDLIGRASGMRVDVFLSSTELTERAARRVIDRDVGDGTVKILAVEDLVLFKLMFFRPKDLIDIRYLLPLAPALDGHYVRTSLIEAVGENDERVRTWDEMTGGSTPPESQSG